MQTESTEMYLITVYRLTRNAPSASTSDIAAMLGISQPSVSEQIKRLARRGYLDHEWREGATLTPEGQKIAVNVLRKHRLLETFLVEMAGYALDEIHDEACRMEHAISDRLADRLEAMLGYPKADPHGHPIPTKAGSVTVLEYPSLAEVKPGERAVIRQVSDWDGAQLSYLVSLGLVPGMAVMVVEQAPFEGPLTLKVGQEMVALAREMAAGIGVSLENL
jgi:DtxR family Mn-dependent transcriptional regulator